MPTHETAARLLLTARLEYQISISNGVTHTCERFNYSRTSSMNCVSHIGLTPKLLAKTMIGVKKTHLLFYINTQDTYLFKWLVIGVSLDIFNLRTNVHSLDDSAEDCVFLV